eukprot:1148777-Pelagomonas_calceolata.AAC.5
MDTHHRLEVKAGFRARDSNRATNGDLLHMTRARLGDLGADRNSHASARKLTGGASMHIQPRGPHIRSPFKTAASSAECFLTCNPKA